MPAEYKLLPLLPLSYGIMSIVCCRVSRCIPSNLGATVIVFLQFFRNSILPLIMQWGGYANRFNANLSAEIPKAIFLSVYETVVVFAVLWISTNNNSLKRKRMNSKDKWFYYDSKRASIILAFLVVVFAGTIIIAPANLKFYQTIFSINKVEFTGNETYNVIALYGTSFVAKLSMVMHMYLMKILRFLLPLHFIMLAFQKGYSYKCSVLIACSTIIIADGSISRSLIYMFTLLILSSMIYNREQKIFRLLALTGLLIGIYFGIRATVTNSNGIEYVSRLLTSYFSGLPNTAATVCIDITIDEKLTYMLYDYLKAIPFGNTLFSLDNILFQDVFNSINNSVGQIPTTIGTGYVYFGALFSPLYSVFFTLMAFLMGELAYTSKNVLKRGIYLLAAIYFAMGIVMYSIQIVFAVIIPVVLPMILFLLVVQKRRPLIKNEMQINATKGCT